MECIHGNEFKLRERQNYRGLVGLTRASFGPTSGGNPHLRLRLKVQQGILGKTRGGR